MAMSNVVSWIGTEALTSSALILRRPVFTGALFWEREGIAASMAEEMVGIVVAAAIKVRWICFMRSRPALMAGFLPRIGRAFLIAEEMEIIVVAAAMEFCCC